jgi:secretion/DNA translocation related CpaE-like protein
VDDLEDLDDIGRDRWPDAAVARSGRALLVSDDPDLLSAVSRAAARAGTGIDVVAATASAAGRWSVAPVVLVGADAADQPVPTGRRDVLLVTGHRSVPAVDALARETGWPVVALPEDEGWLADRLLAVGPVQRPGPCIGVVGGRGGAGASTLAAALAVTASVGARSLLVDLDPLGGGVDLLVGLEGEPGLRWSDLATVVGPLSGSALAGSLPSRDGLSVLSWDHADLRAGSGPAVGVPTVSAVLGAVRRTYDLTVLDLPRRVTGETVPAFAACDTLLLVVPAEVRAVAAAGRVAAQIAGLAPDLRLVVRGPSPSRLTGPDVARLLGLPLAGWLRRDPRLSSDVERGRAPGRSGRGPLAGLSRRLVAELTDHGRAPVGPVATASDPVAA